MDNFKFELMQDLPKKANTFQSESTVSNKSCELRNVQKYDSRKSTELRKIYHEDFKRAVMNLITYQNYTMDEVCKSNDLNVTTLLGWRKKFIKAEKISPHSWPVPEKYRNTWNRIWTGDGKTKTDLEQENEKLKEQLKKQEKSSTKAPAVPKHFKEKIDNAFSYMDFQLNSLELNGSDLNKIKKCMRNAKYVLYSELNDS